MPSIDRLLPAKVNAVCGATISAQHPAGVKRGIKARSRVETSTHCYVSGRADGEKYNGGYCHLYIQRLLSETK